MGPVCVCFASLGTALSLIVSFAQMTWCALTVKQCVIAVVKFSTSRETFPRRCLFPFSIYASVRNLLGHLVSNKKEITYFNLMKRMWSFAYLLVLPFEKLQWWSLFCSVFLSEHQPGLIFSIVTLGIHQLLKTAFGSQQKLKWHLVFCYFKIIGGSL